MKLNKIAEVLMTLGLLFVQICGHARTSNFEESNLIILQDTPAINPLIIDSTSVSNQCSVEYSAFNAKQLILPGVLIAVGSFGVHNEALKK